MSTVSYFNTVSLRLLTVVIKRIFFSRNQQDHKNEFWFLITRLLSGMGFSSNSEKNSEAFLPGNRLSTLLRADGGPMGTLCAEHGPTGSALTSQGARRIN